MKSFRQLIVQTTLLYGLKITHAKVCVQLNVCTLVVLTYDIDSKLLQTEGWSTWSRGVIVYVSAVTSDSPGQQAASHSSLYKNAANSFKLLNAAQSPLLEWCYYYTCIKNIAIIFSTQKFFVGHLLLQKKKKSKIHFTKGFNSNIFLFTGIVNLIV